MQRNNIAVRLAEIRQQITQACTHAGRSVDEVTLVGVSKTVPPELVQMAMAAGVNVLGENRVQEAASKIPVLHEATERFHVSWHLIGHLQSNKARRAVELFDVIESVDSFELGQRLDRLADETNKTLPIFVQVNLGGETAKAGIAADETLSLCEQLSVLAHLELRGLMAIPPFLDNPEQVRPFFRRLRDLRSEAQRAGIVGATFRDLSMGMSHDFTVAIEEGATLVRIGTALFGTR